MQTSLAMETLATETHFHIAQYLEKHEIAALCLTSRRLNNVFVTISFRDVVVEHNAQSFTRMKELSLGPGPLKEYVKRIIYSGLFLPGDHKGELALTHKAAPEIMPNRMTRAQTVLCSQAAAQSSNDLDGLIFKECLGKFPNLECLEFQSGHPLRFHPHPDEKILDLEVSKGNFARGTSVRPMIGHNHHARQFAALLAAACTQPKISKVKTLAIPLNELCTIKGKDLNLGLANIRHLVLGLLNIGKREKGSKFPLSLRFAKVLEKLELSSDRVDTQKYLPLISLWRIMSPGLRLPLLHSLKLQDFMTSANKFIQLLKNHATSLKSLELINITWAWLGTGHTTKQTFMTFVLYLEKSLQLENFHVGGFINGDSSSGPGWYTYGDNKQCSGCETRLPVERMKFQLEDFVVHGTSHDCFAMLIQNPHYRAQLVGGKSTIAVGCRYEIQDERRLCRAYQRK